jgi:hypothetical protein
MKESGIVIAVLLLGFGFESENRYSIKRLIQSSFWVLAGGVTGQIILMVLDQAILGDALFSLRSENWQALFSFNLREGYRRLPGNYLQGIASNEMLVLSVFALLAVGQPETWNTSHKKIIWLLPAATVGFLSVSMISGAWDAIIRYALIMIPVLSVLAACYVYSLLSRSPQSLRWLIVGLVIGSILVQGIVVPWATTRYNWDGENLRHAVLMPVTLVGMGLVVIYLRTHARIVILGWSLCLGLLLLPPVFQTVHDLNNNLTRAQRSGSRWYAHRAFASLIHPSDESLLLTSPSVNADYNYGGREYLSDRWMFNTYLRANLDEAQFIHEPVTRATLSTVKPTYVLMTVNDWQNWSDADQLAVLDEARVFTEIRQRLVFISYASPAPEVRPGVEWFPIATGFRNCRIVTGEAEPGVFEYQCHPPEGEGFTVLGWTYLAGDGSIGTSVADGSTITGDQLKQMAYSFDVYPAR